MVGLLFEQVVFYLGIGQMAEFHDIRHGFSLHMPSVWVIQAQCAIKDDATATHHAQLLDGTVVCEWFTELQAIQCGNLIATNNKRLGMISRYLACLGLRQSQGSILWCFVSQWRFIDIR